MSGYSARTALDDLEDDALLPHPVRLRDLILRARLGPEAALELNRDFQHYLAHFGETQKLAAGILEKLVAAEPSSS